MPKRQKTSNVILTVEAVECMRRLIERPAVPQPVMQELVDVGYACLGYGQRNRDLQLGHPTITGVDWLRDVDSGGRYGAALHFAWYWEQRARFAESVKGETK